MVVVVVVFFDVVLSVITVFGKEIEEKWSALKAEEERISQVWSL